MLLAIDTSTGTNLAGATSVAFGTTAATIVSNSGTQIVATSPAHSSGQVDVRVRTAAGNSPTSTADRFAYVTTTTAVTSSPSANQIRVGSPATFTATVTASKGAPSSPTGTVSFTQDNATIPGCEAVGLSAGSWMLRDRGPRMIEADPEVTSAVDIFVKDLGIVLEAGRETKAALPLTALAFQLFNSTSGRGDGAADDSQVIRAYRALNGAA